MERDAIGRYLSRDARFGLHLFQIVQIFLMQWTGQKIMFDRREIFRHMQRMHVSFFDANCRPVGHASVVDAINEMFTDGVLAIVNDFHAHGGHRDDRHLMVALAFSVPLILMITRATTCADCASSHCHRALTKA